MVGLALCCACIGVFGGGAAPASAATTGAVTPYMGVDTWYAVGPAVNEAVVTQMADAMVADGLVAAGYNILWIDGGWWQGARDANGNIAVSPTLWPHGMAYIAAYLHQRGIRAGIYTDAGINGCVAHGPNQGSYGHYQQDVNTFATWGYDAVKVDFCGGLQMGLDPRVVFRQFGDAIAADSPHKPMIYNVCDGYGADHFASEDPPYENSAYDAYTFDPSATSWRTASDIGTPHRVTFDSVLNNLDYDALHPFAQRRGHWNDPDYVVPDAGMSFSEGQAQFSMWAMLGAPLVLGDDPRTMPSYTRAMLTNHNVIAVDQDPLDIEGWLVDRFYGFLDVWIKPLVGGQRAVALLNRAPTAATVTVPVADFDFGPSVGRHHVVNVWSGRKWTAGKAIKTTVPGDSVELLRVSPVFVGLPGAGNPSPPPTPGPAPKPKPKPKPKTKTKTTTAPSGSGSTGGGSGIAP